MKKLLFLSLLFASSLSFAQATANFNSNATLNGSCLIETNNVALGNTFTMLDIKNNFYLTCSKDLIVNVGISTPNPGPNITEYYLVSDNNLNTDKIVFTLGYGLTKYKNTGEASKLYSGTGSKTRIGGIAAFQLTPIGSVIDGNFKPNEFRITPDTYKSNLTLILTY